MSRREYQRDYYLRNRERKIQYWRGAGRDRTLQRKYGISAEEYEGRLATQKGRCAICRVDTPGHRTRSFHVDHCHATGRIRGLLCAACNIGLGAFRDEPDNLTAAIDYLERST